MRLMYLRDIEMMVILVRILRGCCFSCIVRRLVLGMCWLILKLRCCKFYVIFRYYRKGNFKMYKKYLLLASESGVIEAQHNLGI